ncbi:MFS transporter [Catenulispora sp. GP43]|uniref:MFS transporter n=1 Tax=Catenulispora sp. GP43 TaxID=3156263 RepID=UPI00351489EB
MRQPSLRVLQGAAGSTILACGLSLLSTDSAGEGQMRAVSLWVRRRRPGRPPGPLLGAALVDVTGWQGLFWIDAAIAAACVPLTLRIRRRPGSPGRRSVYQGGQVLPVWQNGWITVADAGAAVMMPAVSAETRSAAAASLR